MEDFVIYPAMDLRHGNVVRLRQGKANEQTIYSNEPERIACKWLQSGAQWLHIVNLDGAFGEVSQQNNDAIKQISDSTGEQLQLQVGGGIRNLGQIERALEMGVVRVVLGTSVVQDPKFGMDALKTFTPERLAFALDALGGELKTHGWRESAAMPMEELAVQLAEAGAKTVIYTDIARDGMQTGVDWGNAIRLAERTGLEVVASGGVATLEDVEAVRSAGLAGVIIGRALYEGNFTLQEALDVR
jgi:phosphoribosylformimino-5-aminoimidazole carboxamide ribotide isomerase